MIEPVYFTNSPLGKSIWKTESKTIADSGEKETKALESINFSDK